MRVGITGGTGLLGRQLTAALVHRGDGVVVFSRSAASRVPGAEVRQWDGVSGPLPADSVQDLDAVVHLAGAPLTEGRWSESRKRELYNSRVVTTRNLIEEWNTLERPPRVLVSGSAIGFYGDRGDTPLPETAKAGEGFLPGLSVDWEAAGRTGYRVGHPARQVTDWYRTRPRRRRLGQDASDLRWGGGGRLGSGNQWMPWIHHADWTRLTLHAIDTDSVSGPLNATAPEPVTNATFTRELASVLGRPAFMHVPAFALKLLLGEVTSALLGSQRVVPEKALATGFSFSFESLGTALRDLLGSN